MCLVGVCVENLCLVGGVGFGFWDDDEDWCKVEGVVDEVVVRFGLVMISCVRYIGCGDGCGVV